MTAVSSLVGFFPLVIASGAGSASRRSIGTALVGGLLVSTILSFLVVPVLYVVIKSLEARFLDKKPPKNNNDNSNGRVQDYKNTETSDRRTDTPTKTRFQEEDNPV
jgi:HAE1 family hydrophobic/amphiphilic exporter-1